MRKMEKKLSKSLKGMTLYEIIISLAIVAVMTVIMITTSSLIDKYTTSSNHVNNKVAEQAPKAETRYTPGAYDEGEIEITVNGNISLKGEAYQVVDPSEPTNENELGGDLRMKFIDGVELTT